MYFPKFLIFLAIGITFLSLHAKANEINFKIEIYSPTVNDKTIVLSDFFSTIDSSKGINNKVILTGSINTPTALQIQLNRLSFILVFIDSENISINLEKMPVNFYDYTILNGSIPAKYFRLFCSEFNPVAKTVSGVIKNDCALDSTCSLLSNIVINYLTKSNSATLNSLILKAASGVQNQQVLKNYYEILKDKYKNLADFVTEYPYHTSQIKEFFNPIAASIDTTLKLTQIDSSKIHCFGSKNQFVLFDFWATWCKPCIEGISELKEIDSLFSNVRVISVTLLSKIENVKKIVYEKKMSWDIAIMSSVEEQNSVVKMFNINFYPTYVLCDKQGKLLLRKTGSGGLYQIKKYIESFSLR